MSDFKLQYNCVRVFQLCVRNALSACYQWLVRFRQMLGASDSIVIIIEFRVMDANAVCAVDFPLSAYTSYNQDCFLMCSQQPSGISKQVTDNLAALHRYNG